MSDDPRQPGDSGWVVEPANPLQLEIAVGPDAELTPELRQALDNLVRAVEDQQDQEVEAFKGCTAKCVAPSYGVCNPEQGGCAPKIWFPCANKSICSVIDELM